MGLETIFETIRGEGGVIFLLLLAVIVFFRGGIVTGRAYETAVKTCEVRLAGKDQEIKFWRDKTLHVLEVGERVVNGEP